MGLPTPNIFTGCGNFHGPFEYASIDVMEKAVQVVVGIAEEVAKRIIIRNFDINLKVG